MKNDSGLAESYSVGRETDGGLSPYCLSPEARELTIYAENDGAIYRESTVPVIKNLCRKIAAGTYDSEKAVKAFKSVAQCAARRYVQEYCAAGVKWPRIFTAGTRTAVAAYFRNAFEMEYECNQYDGINPVVESKRKPLPAKESES